MVWGDDAVFSKKTHKNELNKLVWDTIIYTVHSGAAVTVGRLLLIPVPQGVWPLKIKHMPSHPAPQQM